SLSELREEKRRRPALCPIRNVMCCFGWPSGRTEESAGSLLRAAVSAVARTRRRLVLCSADPLNSCRRPQMLRKDSVTFQRSPRVMVTVQMIGRHNDLGVNTVQMSTGIGYHAICLFPRRAAGDKVFNIALIVRQLPDDRMVMHATRLGLVSNQ